MNYLAPSILSADFTCLGQQLQTLDRAGAQYIHIDVMDGMFVPQISFGTPVIKSIRGCTERLFDVHLMVEEPIRYIDDYADAGADLITVHVEACNQLGRTIRAIKNRDLKASVCLNPYTPLDEVEQILPQVDMVLLMSVEPGFGGQKFLPFTLDRIRGLKQMMERQGCTADIEVDGGVTFENVQEILDAGANVIVAGSTVFHGDIEANAKKLLKLMEE